MSAVSERRRKPRQKTGRPGEPSWVVVYDVPGFPTGLRAKLVDTNDLGLGLETDCSIAPETIVGIEGRLNNDVAAGKTRARVVDCKPCNGSFRVGLKLEPESEKTSHFALKSDESVPDYYELLQISPNADPDMIHRVYRLLAQRYHPDNVESGDEKAFREITEAYKILSEPEKRAAYDVHLQAYRQVRWRIFDQRQAAVGKQAERSKRRGILDLLYTKRAAEPEKPSLNLHELEDLLGCPREHLEFSLWYLKENGLIARMDNGRYAVTVKGVDWAEQEDAAEKLRTDRLLQSAHGTDHVRP